MVDVNFSWKHMMLGMLLAKTRQRPINMLEKASIWACKAHFGYKPVDCHIMCTWICQGLCVSRGPQPLTLHIIQNTHDRMRNGSGSMALQNNDGCFVSKLSYPCSLIGPWGISSIWKYFKEARLPLAQRLREALNPAAKSWGYVR